MTIEQELKKAGIEFDAVSLNGITPTLDVGDTYIHLDDRGQLESIVSKYKNKPLYAVCGYDGCVHLFCVTYDKRLAKKVLKNVEEGKNKYLFVEILQTNECVKPPDITWLFFYNSVMSTWTIEVTEPGDDFDPNWSDEKCYVIRAPTLSKAKKLLKKQYGVEV